MFCHTYSFVNNRWCRWWLLSHLYSTPGHLKAVSYAKFLNGEEIVSASTDSQLKLWNVNKGLYKDSPYLYLSITICSVTTASDYSKLIEIISSRHHFDELVFYCVVFVNFAAREVYYVL